MTVFQRIMQAARKGVGMRLTSEDVVDLARVEAVRTMAYEDDQSAIDFPSTAVPPDPEDDEDDEDASEDDEDAF